MNRKVIAYEDDADLRKQLEYIFLDLQPEFKLVATFPNPLDVITEVGEILPEVVLMDLQMLGEDDGLGALFKIKQTYPEVRVLVLTMFDADQKVFNAICLGADGYMLKSDLLSTDLPQDVIRRSLKILYEDGAYLTPKVAKQITKYYGDERLVKKAMRMKERLQAMFADEKEPAVKETGLTRMQASVLRKIVDGQTTPQIARDFNLSENTINSHIKAMYKTLSVHSRPMVIKMAHEKKWIL